MEKETVIAKLRAELSFSEDFQVYLKQFELNSNARFTQENGNLFLSEFGRDWDNAFTEKAQRYYSEYFIEIGLPEQYVPNVKISDSHSGSWIMEASLTFFGTVGSVYKILKAISELPEIAEGLEKTKNIVGKELSQFFNKEVKKRIEPYINDISTKKLKTLPINISKINYSIDARPLRDLTSDKNLAHSIHLSVGLSDHNIVVENLGDTPLKDLSIGIFKSTTERNNWDITEAYLNTVPLLSGKQSISIVLTSFKLDGKPLFLLDILDLKTLHVDCWIQDNNGIYLFNFLLDPDDYIG